MSVFSTPLSNPITNFATDKAIKDGQYARRERQTAPAIVGGKPLQRTVSTQPVGGPTAVVPNNFQAFDKSVLGDKFNADQGMYDTFTNNAYQQATRTLDPTFDRMRKDFDQRAINQGLAPNTEAYNTALDQYMRGKNDAYSTAAFDAMGYGASRLDADRAASEQQRQFDAAMREAGRTDDNSFLENQRQFDVGNDTTRYGIDKNAATARYGISTGAKTAAQALAEQGRQYDKGYGLQELGLMQDISQQYNDNAYRDAVFNNTMDQQQFNNLFNMQSLAPNAGFQPVNSSGAYDNQLYADIYNNNNKQNLYQGAGQFANDLITNVDWGRLFSGNQALQPISVTAQRK